MKANPGGAVAPDNVIGRNRFIERLWSTLDQLSIVLVAERRMGKTSIVNKMQAEPMPNTLMLVSDVEGVSRSLEFTEKVLQGITEHLSTGARVSNWIRDLRTELGGTEIGGIFKLPSSSASDWKKHLEKILSDLARNQQNKIILIWDEFPWMLQKIAQSESQDVVIDLLDVLRSQRQTHKNLRMVYTGSIGLHHVFSDLNDGGFASAAVNDMLTVEVQPLAHSDAAILASALLKGEGLKSDRTNEVAEIIARSVEGLPYFIHHIVAGLRDRGQAATPETIDEVIIQALTGAQDPWKLEHYRARLKSYYGDKAGLTRAILDMLAEADGLNLGDLHNGLKMGFHVGANDVASRVLGDRERLRSLVKLMQRDHYLRQESDGRLAFRFNLLRRWWRLDLGLS